MCARLQPRWQPVGGWKWSTKPLWGYQVCRCGQRAIARDLGEVHSDTVLSLQFSPDGRMLASGGADKLCRLWHVATGEAVRGFEGHTHHVLGIAWQDNGQRLATASRPQRESVEGRQWRATTHHRRL
ncbi:MAG: hypothetical protein R3C56_23750 [Pirellulaceae bacterium]